MEDDGSALIARSQVHRRHGANALTVHNHVLWSDAIPVREIHNILISHFFLHYKTKQRKQYIMPGYGKHPNGPLNNDKIKWQSHHVMASFC